MKRIKRQISVLAWAVGMFGASAVLAAPSFAQIGLGTLAQRPAGAAEAAGANPVILASDRGHHRGHRGHGRHHGHRGHGHHHGYGHRSHGHDSFSLFFNFTDPPPAYYGRGHNCQPVVQFGYWYGRPANIASTVCYDACGSSYVVNGSAYVVQYLDGRW